MVLLAVNQAGYESGNAGFVAGKTLPLLQDTEAVNAWLAWNVEYRDVVVLDAEGRKRGVLNLTLHNLTVPANRAAMKKLLVDAQSP